jgi:hypothetical protein
MFLRSTIVRQETLQWNSPVAEANEIGDYSCPRVERRRKFSSRYWAALKTARDDSIKAFPAR